MLRIFQLHQHFYFSKQAKQTAKKLFLSVASLVKWDRKRQRVPEWMKKPAAFRSHQSLQRGLRKTSLMMLLSMNILCQNQENVGKSRPGCNSGVDGS